MRQQLTGKSPPGRKRFGAGLTLRFLFAGNDKPQIRKATRIHLDGYGGLVIYRGRRAKERLMLRDLTDIRIDPTS